MSWRAEVLFSERKINKGMRKNTQMQKDKCSGKNTLILLNNSADVLRKSAEDDPLNCLYLYCTQTTTKQQRCEETPSALQESSAGYTDSSKLQNQWKYWDLKQKNLNRLLCCEPAVLLQSHQLLGTGRRAQAESCQHCLSRDFYIQTVAAPCCHRKQPHQPVRRFCWGT